VSAQARVLEALIDRSGARTHALIGGEDRRELVEPSSNFRRHHRQLTAGGGGGREVLPGAVVELCREAPLGGYGLALGVGGKHVWAVFAYELIPLFGGQLVSAGAL